MHFAAESDNENIVRTLIEHGACVNVWDSCGRTPLHFASDHESIRDILIESGAYVSKQNNNRYAPLHFAIEWGCKDVISSLSGNAIVFSKMNDKFPLWYYQPKVVSLYIYTLEV